MIKENEYFDEEVGIILRCVRMRVKIIIERKIRDNCLEAL